MEVAFVFFLVVFSFTAGKNEGRKENIQELCYEKPYDFCEVKSVEFKKKGDR